MSRCEASADAIQPNVRCGFQIGAANTEACNLMSIKYVLQRKSGDNLAYVQYQKLPSVEEWVNRSRPCKDNTKKQFCEGNNVKWIWEAYCFKRFCRWKPYDKVIAPLYISYALGADGIAIIREGYSDTGKGICRERGWDDFHFPGEGSFNSFNPYEENQYVAIMHSWGPQGSLMPYATSTDDWKSCIDTDGKGILCFFDEIYFGNYWFFQGKKEPNVPGVNDYFCTLMFEVRFRPRQIQNNDLLRIMIQRQCSRPCSIDPAPNLWPKCETNCALKLSEIEDEKDYEAPNGTKIKGKELKKHPIDREGYKIPCVPVCEQDKKVISFSNFQALTRVLVNAYQGFEKIVEKTEFEGKQEIVNHLNKMYAPYLDAVDQITENDVSLLKTFINTTFVAGLGEKSKWYLSILTVEVQSILLAYITKTCVSNNDPLYSKLMSLSDLDRKAELYSYHLQNFNPKCTLFQSYNEPIPDPETNIDDSTDLPNTSSATRNTPAPPDESEDISMEQPEDNPGDSGRGSASFTA